MKTIIALLLMTTCAMAEEPVQTCEGRVTTFVGNGEWIRKGVKILQIEGTDCGFFTTEHNSLSGKQILRTCPRSSNCRVKARLKGDDIDSSDGRIGSIVSVTKLKDNAVCLREAREVFGLAA